MLTNKYISKMPIKYADVTVIRNIEEESIFKTIERYFGYENYANNSDTIIIQFDDNSICDTTHDYIDKRVKFGILGHRSNFPLYFDTTKGNNLYYKEPYEENGERQIKLHSILKNYPQFKKQPYQSSSFNVVYEDINEKEKFAILKILSSEEKPRYIVAYDDTLFDKSDIIYLVDYMFKEKKSEI